MKGILFDNRWNDIHGIGRYSANIIQRIENIDFHDLYCKSDKLSFWEQIEVPLYNKGVIYNPGFNAIRFYGFRQFLTVHDLMHIEYYNSKKFQIYYKSIVFPVIEKTGMVFTVSDYSKKNLEKYLSNKVKVINTGNGVDVEKYHYKPDVKGEYFLTLYNGKKHKNIETTLEAYRIYVKSDGVYPIKIVINNNEALSKIQKVVSELRLSNVETIFKPSDSELAELYSSARYLIMVSSYEGFGLPVIEALASGTDVIVTKNSPMAEISPFITKQVDMHDSKGLSEYLMENPTYVDQRTYENIKKEYSWDKVAGIVEESILRHLKL